MATASPPHRRVRFGPFAFDPASGEILKQGRAIKLQDQPRQILAALLDRPGVLVTREELRRRLWPDDTFVDFDNSLNVGVRKTREALGDVVGTARYIETVRGVGYRFVAPVTDVGEAAVVPPAPDAAPASGTIASALRRAPSVFRRRWVPSGSWAGALVIVGLAGLGIWSVTGGGSEIEALAVVPFTNLLGDKSQQYLVDGLTESVTTELAARMRFRVISSQSAQILTDRQASPADMARALDVDALLVGSVARSGGFGLIVNVRLVDARSNRNRWAGRFERASLDDLAISDDITAAIAADVPGAASNSAPLRARTAHVLPEARAAYLRGRAFWNKRGLANGATAVDYLSTAIELQPDYAEAWAGLADVYAVNDGAPARVIVPWPGNGTDAGLFAAREAIRLSPNLGNAHAALGKLYVQQRRWADAEAALHRAVELSPGYSTARQWLGTLYLRLRRCDEALTQVQIGAKLDPLTPLVNEAVGSVYLRCSEPGRAIEVFEAVLRLHPDARTTRINLASALGGVGRFPEAISILESEASPGPSVTTALVTLYVQAGRHQDAVRIAARLEHPYSRARAAASLGDPAAMWAALEQALASNDGALAGLLGDGEFERYVGDPRFVGFANRAGFPVPIPAARLSWPPATPATLGPWRFIKESSAATPRSRM